MARARPTVLQIIPELDTGGAELSTIEIAEAVVASGGRALVLTEGGRLASRLAEVGGEIVFFPAATKNPLRLLVNAARIARLIHKEGVDLVHARSRAPAWSAYYGARQAGVPFVTTYHGAYGENGPLKKFYNSVMARSAIIIANSRYTARLIEDRYGTDAHKIRVIYRGVDGRAFDPDAIAAARVHDLRARWGVGSGQRVVLHAARLTGWKGQRTVIEAAGVLKARGALGDTVFVLGGDAQGREKYQSDLEALIARLGVSDNVKLVGHVSDMPAAFAAAHTAVVASTEPEAFGRAATEAQIMACPVIATNIGAPPETVRCVSKVGRGQATGWLVPPGNSAALADALATSLAFSDAERREIGDRARRHVLASFTLNAMKKQTLGVYDELLGSRLASTFQPSIQT